MSVKRILNWEINSVNQERQEIWRSVDGGVATLIATLDPHLNSYVDEEEVPLKLSVEYTIVSGGSIQGLDVTAPALPVDFTPPFSGWKVVGNGVSVGNGVFRYFANKTNHYAVFDSESDLDLTTAVTRSFHDVDMQQWQAVTDAIQELIGVTDWVWDNPNNQIHYTPTLPPFSGYVFRIHAEPYWSSDAYYRETPEEVITDFYNYIEAENAKSTGSKFVYSNVSLAQIGANSFELRYDGYIEEPDGYRYNYCSSSSTGYCVSYIGSKEIPVVEPGDQTLLYSTIAQKVISNSSSSTEAITLLAEAYLQSVANSIQSLDPAKQFVKVEDIESGLESNKSLRS